MRKNSFEMTVVVGQPPDKVRATFMNRNGNWFCLAVGKFKWNFARSAQAGSRAPQAAAEKLLRLFGPGSDIPHALDCGCIAKGGVIVKMCPRHEYLFSTPDEGGFDLS